MKTKVVLVLVVHLVIAANLATGQLSEQLSRKPIVVSETVSGTDDGFNITINGFNNQVGQTLSNTVKNTTQILMGRQANMMGGGAVGQTVSVASQLVNGLTDDERDMLRRELIVVMSLLNLVKERIETTNSISDLNVDSVLNFLEDASSLVQSGGGQPL